MKSEPRLLRLLLFIGLAIIMIVPVLVDHSLPKGQSHGNAIESHSTDGLLLPVRPGHRRYAFYSLVKIPAGAKIDKQQIEEREMDELELWDDAILPTRKPGQSFIDEREDLVGRVTKHAIPVYEQIRQSDLEQ